MWMNPILVDFKSNVGTRMNLLHQIYPSTLMVEDCKVGGLTEKIVARLDDRVFSVSHENALPVWNGDDPSPAHHDEHLPEAMSGCVPVCMLAIRCFVSCRHR